MYVCELSCDSLTVREIDGSQSKLSLDLGPNKESFDCILLARVCSDDGIVVIDETNDLTKCSKDGRFIWRIKPEKSPRSFCIDSSDLLYCVTGDEVKVYSPSGTFLHVLVSGLNDPMGIAIDGDNNIHVGIPSSIQVFDAKGKLIREYGHDFLFKVQSIAISRDNPQLVVAADHDSPHFLVFSSTGTFLYVVTGVIGVCDVTFGPDNSLWIAQWESTHFGEVVRIPKFFLQLPPQLSYLCELSILPHLNELPVTLLPPRLAGLFEKWTHLVTVEVRRKSFTNCPSNSKVLSEMIELKVEPDEPLEMVQWLVSQRMDIKYSAASIRHSRDEHVDFVVIEREGDSVGDSETSESETEELP